mgnify:CR=1 FL=1
MLKRIIYDYSRLSLFILLILLFSPENSRFCFLKRNFPTYYIAKNINTKKRRVLRPCWFVLWWSDLICYCSLSEIDQIISVFNNHHTWSRPPSLWSILLLFVSVILSSILICKHWQAFLILYNCSNQQIKKVYTRESICILIKDKYVKVLKNPE